MRRRSQRLSSTGLTSSDYFAEHFNTRFSLLSFLKKVRRLTDDQKKAIEKTGFGNLLLIPNQILDKVLILELMRRWDVGKCSFLLPCGFIGPTITDIALILGLRVTGTPVTLDDNEPFLDLENKYGASLWKRKVTVASVESRLDSLGEICNEDFVQTFLLFTFGNFLFPNGDGKVDTRYVSYLKNVDTICSYAWGQAVLVHLIKWLDRRKEMDIIYVGGCLLFLQIWSFEHIDVARPALLDFCSAFPRVCQWDKTKSSNKQQLILKFKDLQDHQVMWELQPTPSESEVDIIKDLLEAHDTVIYEAGSSSADYTIIRDINLGTRNEFRNREIIEVETESETNPTSEGQSEQEVILDIPVQNIPEVRTDVIDCCCSVPCLSTLRKQPTKVTALKDSSTIILTDDEEDVRTKVLMLEAQNMELKVEIQQLKRENERLNSSCSQFDANSANLKSEDQLTRENKFLSLVVARIEKIVLDEDSNTGEIPTEELHSIESAEPVNTSIHHIQSNSPR